VGFGTQALNDRIMTSLHSKERTHVRRVQPVSPCCYDYCTTNKRGKRFVAVAMLYGALNLFIDEHRVMTVFNQVPYWYPLLAE
jgi:hypothetical protein